MKGSNYRAGQSITVFLHIAHICSTYLWYIWIFHGYVEKILAKSRILLQKGFEPFVTALPTTVTPRTIAWWWTSGSRKKTIALENLSGQSLKVIAAAFRACLLLCLSSTTQFKLHCTLNYSQCSWFPDKLCCTLIIV